MCHLSDDGRNETRFDISPSDVARLSLEVDLFEIGRVVERIMVDSRKGVYFGKRPPVFGEMRGYHGQT